MNRLFLILFSISFTSIAGAAVIGKVTLLRGVATVLKPGNVQAHRLKLHEELPEDSSILTQDKSVVRISLNDGSSITLGPKSKSIIRQTSKDTSLVNHIVGSIRAKIMKKNDAFKGSDKERFNIVTKNTAMGVRGTDFQVFFNPEVGKTSLLTFEGKVATGRIRSQKVHDPKKIAKLIHKAFAKKAEVTKMGEFQVIGSSVTNSVEKVKIDPTQFVLLNKDETMGVEKQVIDKKELKAEIKKVKEQFAKDESTALSGGYVSLDNGLYISPEIKKVNKRKGYIDTNGQFVPDKGMKLDPRRGFVALKEDEEAKQKAAKLNGLIDQQLRVDAVDPNYGRYFDI